MLNLKGAETLAAMVRLLSICVVLAVVSGCSASIDLIADNFIFDPKLTRAPAFAVTETDTELVTSNGVTLRAKVFRPEGVTAAPTVLVRIPLTETIANNLRARIIARHWSRRGYVAVIQGTRGRYGSSGDFYPLIHERNDGVETLKWITRQSWYDGRIVMWGGSAFGHTQWAVADQIDPGPKALFVQIASTSFRRMFYPGGAFSLESALYWAIRSRGQEDREVDMGDLIRGAWKLPILEADDEAIGDTNFYNDWILRRDDDPYWKRIDGENRATTLKAPVLLVGGWFDPFLPTQIEDFITVKATATSKVAAETRLIIGPWAHAQSVKLPKSGFSLPYRVESVLPSIPWFDHILGSSPSPLQMPPVKIFVMGKNEWRDENEWPLARTAYTPYYLCSDGNANTAHGDGKLNTNACDSGTPDNYVYDPLKPVPTAGGALLSDRAGIQLQTLTESWRDVLVYTTSVFTKELEITGPLRVILYVQTDRPATDFTAKLVDVHPDGSAYNISDGILRRTYSQRESEPVRIEIELWPTSTVVFEGHKLRLEVSSSNFPRCDRNLNTGESATGSNHAIANQIVFHSAKYPSQLILPVIPEADSQLRPNELIRSEQ